MNRVTAAVSGGVLAMSLWVPVAGAEDTWHARADVVRDRLEIRQDLQEIRQDAWEIRQDRRKLWADRQQLQADRRAGNVHAVKKDLQAIRADRRELRRDVKELRADLRDLRHDRQELRADLRDRGQVSHHRHHGHHATTDGAFARLSPGNQKIARGLFEAQSRSGSGALPRRSLDDIAAMKQSGGGWGGVFRDMKQQGLVHERNLGQVVRSVPTHAHHTVITSGSGRQHSMGAAPAHGPSSTTMRPGASGHRPSSPPTTMQTGLAGHRPSLTTMRPAAVDGHPRAGSGAGMSRGHGTGHGGRHGR
jgi:hypothetical protein